MARKKPVYSEEVRPLKAVPVGEFVRLLHRDGTPMLKTWVLGGYDRSERRYVIYDFDDVCNSRLVKADKLVLVGFTF